MLTRACPKCHTGTMCLEEDEYGLDWVCIQCGNRVSAGELNTAKEIAMPAKVKYNDLPPQTKEIVREQLAADLPPVPEKSAGGTSIIHRYYKANLDLIKQYISVLGEWETRRRWNMSMTAWLTIKKLLKNDGQNADRTAPIPAVTKKKTRTRVTKCHKSPRQQEVTDTPTFTMPAFPSFNQLPRDTEVQVEWLRSYVLIAGGRS